MKSSKYTVMIISDSNDESRQISLTKRFLIISISAVTTVIVLSIILLLYSFRTINQYSDMEEIYNQLLSERISVLNVIQDLQRINQMDQLIRRTLGTDLNFPIRSDSIGSTNELSYGDHISYIENIPSKTPVTGFITKEIDKSSLYHFQNHYGIDIATKKGEPILATADGIVVFSGWTYDWGNMIIIYHGDEYFTLYAHNEKNFIKQWDAVKRSDVIALAGSSGAASGPHLHFEIWKDGKALDPIKFFPEYTINKFSSDSANG